MKKHNLHYQIALTQIDGIGPVHARTILHHFPDLEEFFTEKKLHKRIISGLSPQRLKSLNREHALSKAKDQLEYIEKENVRTHCINEEDYPFRLKNCVDAPTVIYAKGDFNLNPKKVVSVVGTRNITNYGVRLTEKLIEEFSSVNVQVVSGLAFGVDILAHRSCLKHNIPTVGVLAHGLERLYPIQHRNVAQKMIENNGGLLTEFLIGTNPDRENFPKRNRIVAGMADATIVIESGEKGGSLITANLANDYNKDVFAFPGNVDRQFSRGCNKLIASNRAHLVQSAEEIIRLMGWTKNVENEVVQTDLFEGLGSEEKQIVGFLKEKKTASIDQFALSLKKHVSQLNGLLTQLELLGIIKAIPGSKYQLC